jgi:hypothetical protein
MILETTMENTGGMECAEIGKLHERYEKSQSAVRPEENEEQTSTEGK